MSTSDSVSLFIGIGTISGAFLGIFVTSLLSKSHAISSLRQSWINSLRDVFSKYLTQSEIYIEVPDKNSEEAYKEKLKLREIVYQAKLYLNKKEKIAQQLIEKMESLTQQYSKSELTSQDFQSEKIIISDKMQKILKQEWNRVRDGEILWSLNNFFNLICLPDWFYISRIRIFWALSICISSWTIYKIFA